MKHPTAPDQYREEVAAASGLPALVLLAFIVGAASGLIGAIFRIVLARSDQIRTQFLGSAHGHGLLGLIAVITGTAGAAGLAAWLVRAFAPVANGSGIPHVEAVLRDEVPPAPLVLLPVKFLGGVLGMGAGLALGREGPTVQMGATLGHLIARAFRRRPADIKVLLAAGAGAGLATAFSAPMAGAVFVLEELVRRFDTRTTIATLCASGAAIACARLLLGEHLQFDVTPLPYPGFGTVPAFIVLGLVAGGLGILYNEATLRALGVVGRLPVAARATLIGGVVGLLAWFAPDLVGGGDPLTQKALDGGQPTLALATVFLIRFLLGPVSYAAGTPGGLFAPMLVIGAQAGLMLSLVIGRWLPGLDAGGAAFAVVGMAAYFTAVVRAPVTGIVLVTEMTGSFTLLLPMLLACFAAMTLPTMLRNPPIYDSLREPAARELRDPP